jgi:hypothetical protein
VAKLEGTRVALILSELALDPDEVTRRIGFEPGLVRRGSDGSEWARAVSGPSAKNRPLLAGELAQQLLDELDVPSVRWASLRDQCVASVRFSFALSPLLTFSYDLEAPVLARLATLDARVEHCLDSTQPRFDLVQPEVGIEVWTDDRDPHEVTERLGLTPTMVVRKGDRLNERSVRVCGRGVWRLDVPGEKQDDPNPLARRLLEQLSSATSWSSVRADHDVRLRFSFIVGAMEGGFVLDADVVAGFAGLGVPLGCFFYNYCA